MTEAAQFTDLISKVIDNRGKTCPTAERGIPLIATNCVKNETLYPVFEKVRYVSDETFRTWFRGHPITGDLIFVTKGSPGQVCLAPDPVNFCIAQDMVAVRANPSKVYPLYLFAALRSPQVQADIGNMHVGTLIPHFKKGDFDKLKIPLPSTKQQIATGDFYHITSQKIELNRRMNETLEAMAQAIFRDWFVDFGPTRRKLDGATDPVTIMGGLVQNTEQAQGLADLFPAALGDDGLPEGWSFKPLEESLVLQRGFDLPKFSRTDGLYPVIAASGPSGTHSEFKVVAPGVCTGRSGVLGNVFYVQQDFWPLNTSLWIKAYPNATPIYAYFLLREIDLLALNAGSAVPTLNRNHVHNRPTVTPPMAVVSAYTGLAEMLMVKSDHAAKECQTLAATRDFLLPKLMSGEIRLSEAEGLTEAAQ
ncbi:MULTISPECIES: restriction endonuclease subunit S [Rhizobium/Agrobacterium group]|uniref:restriction endonuclease subunit S n=1 Tax=Rhizobium/Agrobacterium group TaxID=227290 RepID=UPI000B3F7C4A|nr:MULTISPECIES: restriction endonuclease subunit S [Rhizobium/Agrobacterium group]OVE98112.1 hypothetical protein B7W85_02015 [Allorhizobium ampelinum]